MNTEKTIMDYVEKLHLKDGVDGATLNKLLSKISSPEFHHESSNILEACGINTLNEVLIRSEIVPHITFTIISREDKVSNLVEFCEALIHSNTVLGRILLLFILSSFIKMLAVSATLESLTESDESDLH